MMAHTLGIDLGTSAAKAVLLSEAGQIMATGRQAYPSHVARPGEVEHDPEDWIAAISAASHHCLAAAPAGASVDAVALSGHMSAVLLLDAGHRPLRPALTIGDTRGSREAILLRKTLGEHIADLTGNEPNAAFALPKLLWLLAHEPQVVQSAQLATGAKDYVRWRLTGELATEPTEAGNWLLLDPRTRNWDTNLAQEAGVPLRLLPEMRESLTLAGSLSARGSQLLGIKAGTPVATGLADMAASVLGCGLASTSETAVTMGTSGQITRLVATVARSLAGKMTFHPHAFPGQTYVMASLFTGGLGLEWITSIANDLNQVPDRNILPHVLELAAQAPVGAHGVIFLPYLTGRGSPNFDTSIHGSLLGLTRATKGSDLARAVLEGVAFNMRENLDELEAALGSTTSLLLAGGGFQSRLWRDIVANVMNHSPWSTRQPDVGPLGAALAAGLAIGLFEDPVQTSREAHGRQRAETPNPQQVEAYASAYANYLAAPRS